MREVPEKYFSYIRVEWVGPGDGKDLYMLTLAKEGSELAFTVKMTKKDLEELQSKIFERIGE